PNELVVGFFLIAACALLYVPAVKRVADAKRLTVGFAAAWCLYALFIINGVFVNKSRVVELVVIIIPVVFLFGRAVFKKDVPFVAAAVLYSSVIVSEAVFLLKLELLSGTGWSLLGNMGFIFSVIGLFLIFSWAFMKMNFKWKRKRAPEVAAEERSEE
ncbi:MAG TPA: hypothetical protein PLQ76_07600, partial [bacterium]|nr:hypothetical protein [bacterium]